MTREYTVVGIVNADVAADIVTQDDTIIVEHDDPDERLLCRPKHGGGDG